MPTVTALEEIREDRKRRHIVFADAPTVELSLEVALAAGLLPGRTVSAAALRKAQREDALKQAEHAALRLLRSRDRSESELRRALAAKGHDAETVDAVIEKCREWGYLDDRRLAEDLVAEGAKAKHLGPARIRQALRQRGIADEAAGAARKKIETNPTALVEQALAALKPKLKSYARLEPEVAKRRIVGFLQRRGFDFGTIREVLKRVGRNTDG